MTLKMIDANVLPGHQIASGQAAHSPYPEGSIKMQWELFLQRGVPLDTMGLWQGGTINLDISPFHFKMIEPDYREDVNWFEGLSEDFMFKACTLHHGGGVYEGFIYYPNPETKPDHFHPTNRAELLMPFIENLSYGDKVGFSTDTRCLYEI